MNKNFRTSMSNLCSKTRNLCYVNRHFKRAQTRATTAGRCCSRCRRGDEASVKQESPGWWRENRPQSGLIDEGVRKKRMGSGKFFQMNEFRSSTNLSSTRKMESPERGHYTAATCLSHSWIPVASGTPNWGSTRMCGGVFSFWSSLEGSYSFINSLIR